MKSISVHDTKKGKRNFIVGKDKVIANPDAFTLSTDNLIGELMLGDSD